MKLDIHPSSPPELTPTSVIDPMIASVIDSALISVDQLIAAIPNPVPSAGQLGHARVRTGAQLNWVARPVRRPLLAGIGTLDLLIERATAQVSR